MGYVGCMWVMDRTLPFNILSSKSALQSYLPKPISI